MKIKVIKTNETDAFLFPKGISTLDEFYEKVISKKSGFIKMQLLSDNALTGPFFIQKDIQDVYVNFDNISVLYEDEAFLLSVAEFEKNLKPFVEDICEGCMLDGNPETDCDKIINKRDKINVIEGSCFLYQSEDDFEEDDFYDDPINPAKNNSSGQIFQFNKKEDYNNEDD